jgi:MFS family permease
MIGVTASNSLAPRRWFILASAVVSFFAVGTTFFAVPPLVSELTLKFGLSHFQIGILMGAIAIPAIALSIPLGLAIDRWPARAAGNVGLGLMVAGAALFAVAPAFPQLVAGRLLFGVGGLIMNLLLARLLSTAFAGRELALAMGVFMAVYPASMIVTFSAHPLLVAALGWRAELLCLAGLAIIAIPLHNVAVPAGLRGSPGTDVIPIGRLLSDLWGLAVSWMLFFAAFASVLTFAPEWIGGGRALLVATAIMWTSLVLSPAAGLVIDRTGYGERWMIGGQVLLALAVVTMTTGIVPPLAAMIAVGLGAAVVPTATYTLPGRLVPSHRLAVAFGLITAFSNLGTVVGPSLTGAIRDASGSWLAPWLAVAMVAAVGAAFGVTVRPSRRADASA